MLLWLVQIDRLRGSAVHCFSFQNLLGHLQDRRLGCGEIIAYGIQRSRYGMDQVEFDEECAVVTGLFNLLLHVFRRHRPFHCNDNLLAARNAKNSVPHIENNSARMTYKGCESSKLELRL